MNSHPAGVPIGRRGRPRAADLVARDRHIVIVAREVFTTMGYARASIDEIARRSGVAKQTLYSAYGGKSELFARVVRDTARPAGEIAGGPPTDAREALLRIARALTVDRHARAGIELMRSLISEMPSQPDLVAHLRQEGRLEALQSVRAVFADLFKRRLLPPHPSAAELFVDLVIGSTVFDILSQLVDEPERLLAERIDFFLAGFPAWVQTKIAAGLS